MSTKTCDLPDIEILAFLDRTPSRKWLRHPNYKRVLEEPLALSAAVRVGWNRKRGGLHELVSFVGVMVGPLVSPAGYRLWITLCHVAGIVQTAGLDKGAAQAVPSSLAETKFFSQLRPRTTPAHPHDHSPQTGVAPQC
jgi:hypothetical protein